MIQDDVFQTETMADILEKQGRSADALRIYETLLRKDPSRTDIAEKLAATREALKHGGSFRDRIDRLLMKWIEAILLEKHVARMRLILGDVTPPHDS
ncbi:MAG: tetratricopeptide repeat protein [Thermodesulfobacteriota bacterium]